MSQIIICFWMMESQKLNEFVFQLIPDLFRMKISTHLIFYLIFCPAFFVLITGCATQRDSFEIIEKTDLPVYEGELREEPFTLRVLFHVMENGSVAEVRMLTNSGDSNWDSAVADSMKKWRFTAHESDSSIWVPKNVKVHLLQSQILNLGELITKNERDARVLHSRLRAGVSFQHLVRQARENSSAGITGRYLNDVDTAQFPTYVSKILTGLKEGEYSRPVQYDGNYVIFKRYGENMPAEHLHN